MKICFEGPSAIGKTTLGNSLSNNYLIIPEVNELFKREKSKQKFWYYEKQLERFQLSQNTKQSSIFDGDIFQPLWYNWIYGYPKEFPSFEETINFYHKKIKTNKVAFPDLYIIFQANLEVLKARKENDTTRKRRNFEKHLTLIQPQKKYFKFLQKNTGILVKFIDSNSVETTQKKVLDLINSVKPKTIDTEYNFQKIAAWLAHTKTKEHRKNNL